MQGDVQTQFRLPTVLDMAAADGFLDAMRRETAAGPSLKLDASGVEVLTLPCIQIIMSALRTFHGVSLENPSAPFVAAFKDLALDWREADQLQPQADTPLAAEPAPTDEIPEQMAAPLAAEPAAVDAMPEPIAAPAAAEPAAADEVRAPDMQTDEISMPKRILTIDDSRTIRDMLNLTLSEAGYEVVQAVDGQDGVEKLDKETRVDLVITDINMPKMDGYGVIRHIRGRAEHKSTPILVLTTESEAEKRNIAREAGATGWMVKPFDPERLIATINKVVP